MFVNHKILVGNGTIVNEAICGHFKGQACSEPAKRAVPPPYGRYKLITVFSSEDQNISGLDHALLHQCVVDPVRVKVSSLAPEANSIL